MSKKWKQWKEICLEGEITLPKVMIWLIGAVCLTAGIIMGLVGSPFTRGITIGSNNIYNNEDQEETKE